MALIHFFTAVKGTETIRRCRHKHYENRKKGVSETPSVLGLGGKLNRMISTDSELIGDGKLQYVVVFLIRPGRSPSGIEMFQHAKR